MNQDKKIDQGKTIEAVVGIFNTPEDASRVAASLRGPDIKLQRVSRQDGTATDNVPNIVYDSVEDIDNSDVASGMIKGGAIGAGSGLLFLGIPGLNIAAPIAGAIAGAWIGGVAGIDETQRSVRLPNEEDYQRMLAEGKSFVVIAGDEAKRMEYGTKMEELGAEAVHQHPPISHVVHATEPQN